jgi:hypothetical protein
MKIQQIETTDENSDISKLFQRSALVQLPDSDKWTNFITSCTGAPVTTFGAFDDLGIAGIVRLGYVNHPLFGKYLVSGPFGGLGGFLSTNDETTQSLFEVSQERCLQTKSSYVNIRTSLQGPTYATYRLPLVTEEVLWNDCLSSTVRNQTRKGLKNNFKVLVHFGGTLEDDVWKVISQGMRELGSPFHKREYLERLICAFGNKSLQVLIKDQDGAPAAATITIFENETAFLLYSITLRTYRPLCVGNLIIWKTLIASLGNATRFDFGRSLLGSSQEHFKKQWGANTLICQSYYWTRSGQDIQIPTPDAKKYLYAAKVWQKLPRHVCDHLGPHLISGLA